jgi:hypothetical protein
LTSRICPLTSGLHEPSAIPDDARSAARPMRRATPRRKRRLRTTLKPGTVRIGQSGDGRIGELAELMFGRKW